MTSRSGHSMEPAGEPAAGVVVGCLMRASRLQAFQARGILPGVATAVPGRAATLQCLAFDPCQDPCLQPPVHVLLHKLSDFDGVKEGPGHAWVRAYLRRHPGTKIVDPVETLGPALDREAMAHAAERASALSDGLRMLRWASLEGPADDDGGDPGFFPCVVKPRVACGGPTAHVMAVVRSTAELQACHVPLPRVAQEWVDGGGAVLKVYVAGEATSWRLLAEGGPLPDSKEGSAGARGGKTSRAQHPGARQGPDAIAVNAASALRRTLGWMLFGADLVCCSTAGLWSIVDINYFPSYLGIQDADGLLHSALVDCAACRDSLNGSRDRA
uniref:inositol-1,3,4-trisphosphate 5/6-kinase n=1 Tax=Auxenochlorella protothecoides TaxID=3075 RepID=A0A1D2A0D4_AUXPR